MIQIETKVGTFIINETDIISGKKRYLKNINNLTYLKFKYNNKQVALFGNVLKSARIKENV